MHFGCVDLPNELVDSRRSGNLVVFAGAGVSIPAPSNLPDFEGLAIELARGTKTREEDEPLDRFLGRLADNLRIHERVRDLLLRPDSRPNPLHFDLLRLFGGASAVRLVTTNFDNHFSASAEQIWTSVHTEVFSAPALPVGGDFLGIVHLHGSVMKDPRRMVLTDVDFGKAYLTEGWARRFLQEMFSKYVVLFVGYSHNDPVVHYLARGLPSSTEGKRFALTKEGNERFWKHLGIVALPYPVRNDGDSHRELVHSVAKWATFTAERPLDKRDRIRNILSNSPPGAGEDHDYLVEALSDFATTRQFTEFATVDWFDWLQGRDRFIRLFRRDAELKDINEPLAYWFAEKFVCEHSGKALDWIARNGLTLGTACWFAVAREIFRKMCPGNSWPRLEKWVTLLIQTRPERTGDELEYILSKCRYPEDATAALLLFQHLLRPWAEMKPNRRRRAIDTDSGPDVDLDLGTVGDGYWLRQAWQGFFLPNLQQFGGPLVSIVAAHLEESALLSRACDEWWDRISIRVPDLERTGLPGRWSGLGVLVEAASQTLVWLIKNSRKRADGLIETWWNSGSLVLRRLAVFGVAHSSGWPQDEKLRWLLERDLLYRVGFGREVSAVLKEAFHDASPKVKDLIVDAVLTVPTCAAEYRNDWIRATLWTLKTADPDCARVVAELAKIPSVPEYVPEAEPTPLSGEDLLASSPEDRVDQLLADEARYAARRDQGGLPTAVQRAVREKPEWGIELATALRQRSAWETALWRSIVAGLNQDGLSTDQWTSVLDIFVCSPQVMSNAIHEIVDLLEGRTSADSNPFQGPLLAAATRVGSSAWKFLESREEPRTKHAVDWLLLAINDAGGRLAQFYLRTAWQARKDAGNTWRGLTADFRFYFESVIQGSSWAAELARIVTASGVQTLFALDPAWTRDNVVQLFDWGADARRAQQAWDGYLTWGNWSDDLLEHMLPRFRQTFDRIEDGLREHAERFCEVMASVALYGAVNPMDGGRGWLPEFSRAASLEARRNWSSAVARILPGFPERKRPEIWARWMRSYWEYRLGPGPLLDPGEVLWMADWSVELEEAFPEAVAFIMKGPAAEPGDMTELCLRLRQSGTWRTYPQESAMLLSWLSKSQNRFQFGDYIVDLVKDLAQLGADAAVLVEVCQRLEELGDTRAEGLKRDIESHSGGPRS